jgi:hypothetical protein
MKTLKYILVLIIVLGTSHSCLVDQDTNYDLNNEGPNLATFDRVTGNLSMTATGEEKIMKVKMKVVGPTVTEIKNNISVTVTADESSTAVEGDHYRIENLPLVLTPDQNFLGELEVILMSEGNAAPMDGTPEFEDYEAPVLVLNVTATGDPNVTGSGKQGTYTLNFVPPNPYAGDYTAHVIYRHPAAGTYPDNINVEDDYDKTLSAITGRKCETAFAVWEDLCWITVLADYSISFQVADSWPYVVNLGDPYDPSKISHYDPATGIIYLYYNYLGASGYRIFWETFTPKE